MNALDNADRDVKAVKVQIAAVERALLEPNADILFLRKEKDQLRKEKEQLRDGKNKIQDGMNHEKKKLVVEIKARQSPGK